MRKTYTPPTIVATGDAIDLTQGAFSGTNDTDRFTAYMPAGSVGFGV